MFLLWLCFGQFNSFGNKNIVFMFYSIVELQLKLSKFPQLTSFPYCLCNMNL